MKTLYLLLSLLTLLPAYSQDNLPKPVGLVNDFENIFTDEQEMALTALLQEARLAADAEIAVVTISKETTSNEEFEAFTMQLANGWGIGEAGKDNGILIAVSAGHRRIRIQNSNGIVMRMSDTKTKAIIDEFFIPHFKKNEYYEGIVAGIREIVEHLKGNK